MRPGTVVFIDELHFFEDGPETIRDWYQNCVAVIGTTLNRGNETSGDFWTHKLVELGVPVSKIEKRGICGARGCRRESVRTARVTPVGSSWVGGAEHYTPTCEAHFYCLSVLHGYSTLLHSPAYYERHELEFQFNAGIRRHQLAPLANAAVVALRRGLTLQLVTCPECEEPATDFLGDAEVPSRRHVCQNVMCPAAVDDRVNKFYMQDECVANKLAICEARLHPRTGKLVLSVPRRDWRDEMLRQNSGNDDQSDEDGTHHDDHTSLPDSSHYTEANEDTTESCGCSSRPSGHTSQGNNLPTSR